MSTGKYKKLRDGEWYRQPEYDRACCCDCGLVHDVQTTVEADAAGRPIVLQKFKRNARATAQVRRGMIQRGEL